MSFELLKEEGRDGTTSLPRSFTHTTMDWRALKSSGTVEFETKSAYYLICGRDPTLMSTNWGLIWKLKSQPRIQLYIWLCCRDRVLTADQLRQRGMNVSVHCSSCRRGAETTDHILRHCPVAVAFWERLVEPNSKKASFWNTFGRLEPRKLFSLRDAFRCRPLECGLSPSHYGCYGSSEINQSSKNSSQISVYMLFAFERWENSRLKQSSRSWSDGILLQLVG